MAKSERTTKDQSPFDRFQSFTKALLAVPHKEVQVKLEKYGSSPFRVG